MATSTANPIRELLRECQRGPPAEPEFIAPLFRLIALYRYHY
jgi:hypothetical protein